MKTWISITVIIVAAVLVAFSVAGHTGASSGLASTAMGQGSRKQAASVDEIVPSTGNAASQSILQFKAANHLLGFQPNRAYVVGMDHALSVEFLGTPGVMPKAAGEVEPESDRSGASPLTKVVYPELWEGINLVYEARAGGVAESTYEVAPGADASRIRLRYNVPVSVQVDGSLRLIFERGVMTESAPVAWQEIEGKQVPVEVAFRVSGDEVGFRVGAHDGRHPLIIDPTYAWHTFYGSISFDYATVLARDAGGNIYVAGHSAGPWNGPSGESPLHPHSGNWDIVVLKLSSVGVYQWHTFYGSAGDDTAMGIAVDAAGNLYVRGLNTAIWNGPLGQAPLVAAGNCVVLKLNSAGVYQWHTFYPISTTDTHPCLALDGGGNPYVTGYSDIAWNGPSGESPLHPHSGTSDIVVLKLYTSGLYQWHTFYGSWNCDVGNALAVDSGGNAYVTGYICATWNGPSGQAPVNAYSGSGTDTFVLKLNSNGVYQWHTFHGHGVDRASALALDGGLGVYVAGISSFNWNGPASRPPLHAHSGGNDLFVLKLNIFGGYYWHTFYGSASEDNGYGLAADADGNVYAAGSSDATWNGPAGQSPLHAHSGGYDLSLLKLNSSGGYQWHTFYGSAFDDRGFGFAADPSGSLYVVGHSNASWNGPTGQPPLHAHIGSGTHDLFVLKMDQSLLASDFGDYGLYLYQDGGWNKINVNSPQGAAYAAGISTLFVDFGDSGLWGYDGATWSYINVNNPENIVASATVLYADFGIYGLYRYEAGNWVKLSGGNPEKMVASGYNLFVDFGAAGLWKWADGWTQLNVNDPEDMITSGSVLYVDFGIYGLYKYGGFWALLSGTNPEKMVVSGDNLYVDFGAAGLWRYNGAWTKLNVTNPEDIAAFGSTFFADFGSYGLYKYEAGSWTLLSGGNPETMTVGGATLYADFGGAGLWKYERNAWTFLSATNPESLYGYIP